MSSTTPREFILSREEVYELVWTTPIQKLAFEWGISDVGLAKTLKRMQIPRPGRGYWARIATGQKPKRTRLPQVHPDDESILRVFRSPLADMPRPEAPHVRVPDKLESPHEVTRWALAWLKRASTDECARQNSFRVGARNKGRALRIVDALAKTLAARNHQVLVGKRYSWSSDDEIIVKADDEGIPLAIDETPDQRLCLRVLHAPHGYRKRRWWRDDDEHRLEDQLGRAILAIEEIVHVAVVEDHERKQREHQRLVEHRRQLREERIRRYYAWLADDLDQMVASWEHAQRIRAFLAEYKRHLPANQRPRIAAVWLASAAEYAEKLDPMNQVDLIAKDMEPSDEVLEKLLTEEIKKAGLSK